MGRIQNTILSRSRDSRLALSALREKLQRVTGSSTILENEARRLPNKYSRRNSAFIIDKSDPSSLACVPLSNSASCNAIFPLDYLIGVDECGVGALAGPIVAVACQMPPNSFGVEMDAKSPLLRDSKSLSNKLRSFWYNQLTNIHSPVLWSYAMCDARDLDESKVLSTRLRVISTAVKQLIEKMQNNNLLSPDQYRSLLSRTFAYPRTLGEDKNTNSFSSGSCWHVQPIVIVDGVEGPTVDSCLPDTSFRCRAYSCTSKRAPSGIIPVRKADETYFTVAAASIIGKQLRDELMTDVYHKLHPSYGFDQHKGYATDLHVHRLRSFGPTSIHRSSYSRKE